MRLNLNAGQVINLLINYPPEVSSISHQDIIETLMLNFHPVIPIRALTRSGGCFALTQFGLTSDFVF